MITSEDFTRANNDINGNPRYICHFLALNTPAENADFSGDFITRKYNLALARARKLGGKKFHNKQYGGGIIFTTYNLRELCDQITATSAQLLPPEAAPPLAVSPEKIELF